MPRGYSFTKRSAKRVVAAVRKIEQQPPTRPPAARRRNQKPEAPREYLCKLTSQLNWASSATAKIWQGTPGAESASQRSDITVWDWLLTGSGSYVASGKKVIVRWINGAWYVVSAECA